MNYKIIITSDAEEDLDIFLNYLIEEKRNKQAAQNLLNDFEKIICYLEISAGSLQLCNNPKLREKEYRRINFYTHNYFIIYKVIGDSAYVLHIFHVLQDYENLLV